MAELIIEPRTPINIYFSIDMNNPIKVPDSPLLSIAVLASGLIPVWPRKVRIFQGWRYLEETDVPADMPIDDTDETPLPISLAKELRELGLL